jgi:adenine-specific DNA-methyltransferase
MPTNESFEQMQLMHPSSLAAPPPSRAHELGARGSRVPLPDGDPGGPLSVAAAEVLSALPLWWERRAQTHGLSGRWSDLGEALEGGAPIETLAVSGTAAEKLAYLTPEDLGRAYVSALDPGVRARHGRHYTPVALAEHLWAMARFGLGQRRRGQPLPGLVLDPACGAGALLLPPLRQHLSALTEADPRVTLAGLPRLIQGIDADPSAAWIANVVLAAELLPLIARIPEARRRPLPMLARSGNGLAPLSRRARAVVMNPPYGRVRLDEPERARWGRYLYGHANLYSLFLAAGLESLDDDGVLAALVPTSFLAGRYFASLRAELARQAPLREVTFVEERSGVFAGVLQETCLATFTRRRARRTAIASANGRIVEVAKVSSPRGDRPWVLPRRADDAHVAAAAATLPLTLASAGWRVSTGPLVWNRRKADLNPVRRKHDVQVLWAADLDGGQLHHEPSKKDLRWLTMQGNEAPVMLLEEPAVLVQRTTSPEQRRRIVCVEFTPELLREWGDAIVVENHVNVIRFTAPTPPRLSLSALAAVLSTRTIDRLTRCISGSVALSAYELESLPLPDVSTLSMWDGMRGEELEAAVAAAYRPGIR